MQLPAGYEIRELSNEDFFPLFQKLRPVVFEETLDFNFRDALNESEQASLHELHKRTAGLFTCNLGLYFEGELVGWTFGRQETAEKFYMVNSAVLPAHRRKGLYHQLMMAMMSRAKAVGFQILYSRHTSVNSAILIAKMKAGFVITAMELSDSFGLLVHLSYFTNPTRTKVLEFRAGERRPDDELRKHLKL